MLPGGASCTCSNVFVEDWNCSKVRATVVSRPCHCLVRPSSVAALHSAEEDIEDPN